MRTVNCGQPKIGKSLQLEGNGIVKKFAQIVYARLPLQGNQHVLIVADFSCVALVGVMLRF